MTRLSDDEMIELRGMLSGLDISTDKQDEFIRIIDNFVASFAQQAHGLSPIQVSLSKEANYSFAGVDVCATVRKSRRIGRRSSQGAPSLLTEKLKEPPTP